MSLLFWSIFFSIAAVFIVWIIWKSAVKKNQPDKPGLNEESSPPIKTIQSDQETISAKANSLEKPSLTGNESFSELIDILKSKK